MRLECLKWCLVCTITVLQFNLFKMDYILTVTYTDGSTDGLMQAGKIFFSAGASN